MTGIQRVQIEYAKTPMRLHDAQANVFSSVHDLYHDLNALFDQRGEKATPDVFGDIRRMDGLPLPLPLRSLLKLKLAPHGVLVARDASNLGLAAGGVLYVGGAFWAHPRSIRTYERAARAGCDPEVLFHDFIPLTFPPLTDGRGASVIRAHA